MELRGPVGKNSGFLQCFQACIRLNHEKFLVGIDPGIRNVNIFNLGCFDHVAFIIIIGEGRDEVQRVLGGVKRDIAWSEEFPFVLRSGSTKGFVGPHGHLFLCHVPYKIIEVTDVFVLRKGDQCKVLIGIKIACFCPVINPRLYIVRKHGESVRVNGFQEEICRIGKNFL